MGFDEPRTLGQGEGGGSVAGVVFTEFMERALADEGALPFRIPPGVRLVSIDATTGQLPQGGASDIILEAFRPGTEPGMVFAEDTTLSLSSSGNSFEPVSLPVVDPETGEIIEDETIIEDVDDGIY